MRVIFDFKAEFTNLNVFANNALILSIIDNTSFATGALE
jgi:hypothetical protein